MKHRVSVQVNLETLARNYNYISTVAKNARVMAVVKADAYGHGAREVAKRLEQLGCTDFAVACLSEARELREFGIKGNILILGPTDESLIGEVVQNNFIQTVDSLNYAQKLSEHGNIRVHIKVDTGMSRLGIYCQNPESVCTAAAEIEKIHALNGITVDGIFTHFAESDGESEEFTNKQFKQFSALLSELESRGINVGTRHCCNSAAILRHPEMHLDMVRAGIILYGLMPSKYINDKRLSAAMRLTARISAVRELKKGDCVSYGCTYKTEKDTRVAVVAIGYADGFSRVYSGKELIRINGKSFATVGRICMDMCMVDIGQDFECSVGDEAVIFESSEDIEKLANVFGTINYEIVCSLKHRAELEYI